MRRAAAIEPEHPAHSADAFPPGAGTEAWRAHHARAVIAASPVALDLLSHLDLDADALVASLGPRGDWRRWVCGPPPTGGRTASAFRSVGAVASAPGVAGGLDAFLHGAVVVREWGDPSGALGVRLSPAGLEVGARIGPVHLRTIAGVATITTAAAMPEVVRAASVGRPVEAVFDHPVLRGRGYIVADQYDRVPTRDDPREAWRIESRAEPVPWRVPWARDRARRMPADLLGDGAVIRPALSAAASRAAERLVRVPLALAAVVAVLLVGGADGADWALSAARWIVRAAFACWLAAGALDACRFPRTPRGPATRVAADRWLLDMWTVIAALVGAVLIAGAAGGWPGGRHG